MKLFNTKTQTIERFQPLDDQVVLYVDGREPSEEMQLSHLFLYCTVDVLVRYLELRRLRIKYTQIIDDTSDRSLLKEWAGRFVEVMRSLNVRPPDYVSMTAEELTTTTRRLGRNGDIWAEVAVSASARGERTPIKTESVIDQVTQARFWLQTAAVNATRPNTKSSSSRSSITAQDMLRRFSGDVIRIYLAQRPYRSYWTPDQILLEKAAQHAERLSAAMEAISTGDQPLNFAPVWKRFEAALDNDLDSIRAIATLLNLADEILFRAPNNYQIDEAQAALRQLASVFGLRLDREPPEGRGVTGWHEYQKQIELAIERP